MNCVSRISCIKLQRWNTSERSLNGTTWNPGMKDIETHGRAETEVLLEGLETIPLRVTEYKGVQLAEMDLDAVLARRPKIMLVDELAHTNAPNSRHAKRYQDVEEILNAGIDVYSTLNDGETGRGVK